MEVTKSKFGMLCDGTKVNLYTVKNGNMSFSCTDYGCTITSIVLSLAISTPTDIIFEERIKSYGILFFSFVYFIKRSFCIILPMFSLFSRLVSSI